MWLEEQVPGLAGEINLYQDPHTGTPVGERWREALRSASAGRSRRSDWTRRTRWNLGSASPNTPRPST